MAELDKRNSTPPHTHTHTNTHTHAHHTTPISAIIVIHLSVFLPLPPLSLAFITGVHGALLLYDSLATIVRVYTCVCVWADKGECTALSLLTVHAVITLRAQHIASDVNSWGDKFTALAELWSTERMCLATFKVDALLHCSALTSPHPQLTPPSHQQQQQ